MPTSHSLIVNKTARYYTLGEFSKSTKSVWFVIHGYEQLAGSFIKEFSVLENETTYIIAPEAFNKFYLKGFTGKIGATWLTKEDREDEINDYSQFINEVYKKELKNTENVKVNILGFSQGGHTCVRWMDKYKPKINNLFLWGSSFPHDCNLNDNYWANLQAKIIIGNNDRFINEELIKNEESYLKSQNVNFSFLKFEGNHEIVKDILIKLSQDNI